MTASLGATSSATPVPSLFDPVWTDAFMAMGGGIYASSIGGGGGGFAGLVTVAAIMFVVLIPYFAFRDIGRALGPDEMRRLLFSRLATAGT